MDVEPLLRVLFGAIVLIAIANRALNAGFGLKAEPVEEDDRV